MKATTATKRIAVAAAIASSLVTYTALSAVASPARAPKAYDAIVLCNAPSLQEDALADVKLVQFERAPEGLVIVFRCDKTY